MVHMRHIHRHDRGEAPKAGRGVRILDLDPNRCVISTEPSQRRQVRQVANVGRRHRKWQIATQHGGSAILQRAQRREFYDLHGGEKTCRISCVRVTEIACGQRRRRVLQGRQRGAV